MKRTNNTNTNIKAIVRVNFMVATFDAMHLNYFSKNYDQYEETLGAAMDIKIGEMSDDDIHTFALAIIDGGEVNYDIAKEDFYLTSK